MQMPKPEDLEQLNEDLQEILDSSPKDRLARSARLLGMYLALYKHHFGELSPNEYNEINSHVAVQDDLGPRYLQRRYVRIDRYVVTGTDS